MSDVFAAIVAEARDVRDRAFRYYVTQRRSLPSAAAMTGVSEETLKTLLAEIGVPLRADRRRRERPQRRDRRELAEEIGAEYADGALLHALCDKYRMSPTTARQLIAEAGVEFRSPGRRPAQLTPAQRAEVVRLYRDEDMCFREIQDRLGVTSYRIGQALSAAGVTARSFKRRPNPGTENPSRETIERLIGRYNSEGIGLVRLAQEEGWGFQRLRSLFLAEGVRLRPSGPNARSPFKR